MVMVGSGRKTAEVSAVWWLRARRPLSSATRAAPSTPSTAWLSNLVTVQAAASPQRHLPPLGRVRPLPLPEGEGPECLQGHLSWGGDSLRTPSPTGRGCGETSAQSPSPWPSGGNSFPVHPTFVCRQVSGGDGGLTRSQIVFRSLIIPCIQTPKRSQFVGGRVPLVSKHVIFFFSWGLMRSEKGRKYPECFSSFLASKI